MRQILQVISSEDDWQDVVEYIRGLPAHVPPATLQADLVRGRSLYTPCTACHGSHAEGNEALNAPPLRWLPDWYIVRQLQKFRSGVRGAVPDDAPGNQMRAIALTLQSDADMAALAAYIARSFQQ